MYNKLWQKFYQSGKVSDYLAYKKSICEEQSNATVGRGTCDKSDRCGRK